MKRLVFLTQQVDPAHPGLGATVPKIAALAERVDDVCVLADAAVPDALPPNCRVRLFGARGKLGRGLRFEAALARELWPRPAAIVAHMCPIYAVLAAPLVRPLRIPLLLWYTHWHASSTLRLAERLATRVVTVDPRSFPLPSAKVCSLGHGIDVTRFRCLEDRRPTEAFRVLALGRYSPAKGLDTVLRAFRLALDSGLAAELDSYGSTVGPLETQHRRELDSLVEELALGERARLHGPVAHAEVPGLLEEADVLVNNMRAGAPDKVVYEAAAACRPVLASNPVFDGLFADLEPALAFQRHDPAGLAERLAALARLDPAERARLGRALRERVAADHSVRGWAEGILRVADR